MIGLGEEPELIGVYNSSTQKFAEREHSYFLPKLKKLLYKKSGWCWGVFWLVILIGVGSVAGADAFRSEFHGLFWTCVVGIPAFIVALISDITINAGKVRDIERFNENMFNAIKEALPDAIKDIHVELAMVPIAVPANASIRTPLENQPSSNSTFCVKCGTSIVLDSKFCGGCGTGLATA